MKKVVCALMVWCSTACAEAGDIWSVNFEDARAAANAEKKDILLYFYRSSDHAVLRAFDPAMQNGSILNALQKNMLW